ncbi:MAG: hypothetical protein LBE20_00220 [Deltaproteobacteria bacterium]|jgi:hypothetical protein|nr:hypothetical protein [Deltaproteobacteria bacterium]
MENNPFQIIKLNKGEVHIYDFGEIKLHAYKTNDSLNDEIYILEKNQEALIIETPCFFENIKELELYLSLSKLQIAGILVMYRAVGASFLPDVKRYSTKNAVHYCSKGTGRIIIDCHIRKYGEIFDSSVPVIHEYIDNSETVIAGIRIKILNTSPKTFNVELPDINAVYLHLFGHHIHSVVPRKADIIYMISHLKSVLNKSYDLVLTPYYSLETLKDIQNKIEYFRCLHSIAGVAKTPEEFKRIVQKNYPNYRGKRLLNRTSKFFFAHYLV